MEWQLNVGLTFSVGDTIPWFPTLYRVRQVELVTRRILFSVPYSTELWSFHFPDVTYCTYFREQASISWCCISLLKVASFFLKGGGVLIWRKYHSIRIPYAFQTLTSRATLPKSMSINQSNPYLCLGTYVYIVCLQLAAFPNQVSCYKHSW
jgi:hypothetical protein